MQTEQTFAILYTQTNVRRDIMENKSSFQLPIDSKHSATQQFMLKQQMPTQQIDFFIQQAITMQYNVCVQLNPTINDKRYLEMKGNLHLLGQQKQLVLQSADGKLTFFIDHSSIRHIMRQDLPLSHAII